MAASMRLMSLIPVFCIVLSSSLVLPSSHALGQSTISDRPLELTFAKGIFGVQLPQYSVGTSDQGGSAYHDDGDTIGALWELKAVRRFLGTRTSFETNAFYGIAFANSNTDPSGVDIPSPISGASNVFSGGRTHLDADVSHYGFDASLRDTWRTQFGGLSTGCGFSYMAFDQDFDVKYSGARLFEEELDSDFVGGKAFVGWDGLFLGRQSNVDLTGGFYDVTGNYQFSGGSIAGSKTDEIKTTSGTFDASFTTWTVFAGRDIGMTGGAMYIAEMPSIQRDASGASVLGTDDAAVFRLMVQILL